MTRPPEAATRRTVAGPKQHSTGSRPITRCRQRSACTTTCSADPTPGATAATSSTISNPASETVLTGCRVEPSLAAVPVGQTVQFERLGYFTPDPDSTPDHLVFNRTLTLKDTWAKVQARDR